MTKSKDPSHSLVHLVDMRTSEEVRAKVDMTVCGMPAMECNRLQTDFDLFMRLPLDESCVLCEMEYKRREFSELDNQE